LECYQSHVPLTSSNNFSFQEDIYASSSSPFAPFRGSQKISKKAKSVSLAVLAFPFSFIFHFDEVKSEREIGNCIFKKISSVRSHHYDEKFFALFLVFRRFHLQLSRKSSPAPLQL
jgi:hypothetical protein